MLTSKLSIYNPTILDVKSCVTCFDGKEINGTVEAVNVSLENHTHKKASLTLYKKEAKKLIRLLNREFKFYKLSKTIKK